MRRESQAKQSLDETAYKLFSEKGINLVGIDELIARSGVARMTLYRHYKSKEDLVLAFLDLRVKRWAFEWLEAEATKRTKTPSARLLAIFDLFDEWFQESDFRGCQVANVLIQSKFEGRVHSAAARKLAEMRSLVGHWATESGLAKPGEFALTWHILMMGSIVAAQAGERTAAVEAKRAAALVLKAWPRRKTAKKAADRKARPERSSK